MRNLRKSRFVTVNGTLVEKDMLLKNLDIVQFGKHTFRFEVPAEPAYRPVAPLSPIIPSPKKTVSENAPLTKQETTKEAKETEKFEKSPQKSPKKTSNDENRMIIDSKEETKHEKHHVIDLEDEITERNSDTILEPSGSSSSTIRTETISTPLAKKSSSAKKVNATSPTEKREQKQKSPSAAAPYENLQRSPPLSSTSSPFKNNSTTEESTSPKVDEKKEEMDLSPKRATTTAPEPKKVVEKSPKSLSTPKSTDGSKPGSEEKKWKHWDLPPDQGPRLRRSSLAKSSVSPPPTSPKAISDASPSEEKPKKRRSSSASKTSPIASKTSSLELDDNIYEDENNISINVDDEGRPKGARPKRSASSARKGKSLSPSKSKTSVSEDYDRLDPTSSDVTPEYDIQSEKTKNCSSSGGSPRFAFNLPEMDTSASINDEESIIRTLILHPREHETDEEMKKDEKNSSQPNRLQSQGNTSKNGDKDSNNHPKRKYSTLAPKKMELAPESEKSSFSENSQYSTLEEEKRSKSHQSSDKSNQRSSSVQKESDEPSSKDKTPNQKISESRSKPTASSSSVSGEKPIIQRVKTDISTPKRQASLPATKSAPISVQSPKESSSTTSKSSSSGGQQESKKRKAPDVLPSTPAKKKSAAHVPSSEDWKRLLKPPLNIDTANKEEQARHIAIQIVAAKGGHLSFNGVMNSAREHLPYVDALQRAYAGSNWKLQFEGDLLHLDYGGTLVVVNGNSLFMTHGAYEQYKKDALSKK